MKENVTGCFFLNTAYNAIETTWRRKRRKATTRTLYKVSRMLFYALE